MKYNGIHEFLIQHRDKNPFSFHMPGHKGSHLYKRFGYEDFLQNFVDLDITEIPGADNLFQAEGIIKNTQELYTELYGADRSYLLINGTSGGIIAAILACVAPGEKLIMARNSHKSVFNALALAGARPVYAYPELIEKHGVSGGISPKHIESLLLENESVSAIILPSPNYYGICSDIRSIAEIAHKYGKILIVDQAHGAHLKMFEHFGIGGFPKSAEDCGADIVINSIHKTLASFTQSALLNLNSSLVSHYDIEDKLQMIESTSPSYLLMASLDISAKMLKDYGKELMSEWADNLAYFREEAKKIEDLILMDADGFFDQTKINLSFERIGLNGFELEQLLMAENIFTELSSGNYVMCMTGIGNTRSNFEALLEALKKIRTKIKAGVPRAADRTAAEAATSDRFTPVNTAVYRSREIFDIPKTKERLPLQEASGRICMESVIPYPPGIPLICPGEKYDAAIIDYLLDLKKTGAKIIGLDDLGRVVVNS